jgi:hypothetical protein
MKKYNLQFPGWVAVALILMISSSCSTYVRYKYGIKNPGAETVAGLIRFLEKNGYPITNQYLFADTTCYRSTMQAEGFRKNLLSFMIFDRNGRLLEKDTARCQWAGFDVIRSLHPDTLYKTDTTFHFSRLEGCIGSFGMCRCFAKTEPAPDFVVVITWGKFLGRYNYRLFDLEQAVRQNRHAGIRLVWLNIDMQRSWNLGKGNGIVLQ